MKAKVRQQAHTCTSIADGCSKSTMSTYKTNKGRKEKGIHKRGKKVNCGACASNVAAGKPQHAIIG